MGTEYAGDRFPEGPINWGPIVGDQMSGDRMRLGPNLSKPDFYLDLAPWQKNSAVV